MKLTQKVLKTLLHYNEETGVFTWHKDNTRPVQEGQTAGRIHTEGYRRIMISYRFYHASRLAWLYVYGKWPRGEIDHINGNRSDDRLSNLREVTHRVNQQNLSVHRQGHLPGTTKTKIPGLTKPWRSRVYYNGRSHFLGCFATQEEAHIAYTKAVHDLQEC